MKKPKDRLIKQADKLLKELFPICRSITGDGVRQTLRRLSRVSGFSIKEVPTGTVCYDWVVPQEWNIRDAFIRDSKGRKIIDFSKNNLHAVNYSIPVDKNISFSELEKHLHYLSELPEAVPYRTSYYHRDWGFCLSYRQYKRLDKRGKYHVFIDSSIKNGSLTYGEELIKGNSGKEYLISTYCCHPSLANDNLSGQVLWALLLKELKSRKMKHSYRFVIVPETIGAIAYLSRNEKTMKEIEGGFVITTVAGPGKFGYKHTWCGDDLIDRVAKRALDDSGLPYELSSFDVSGSDEKQYSSPCFRIPVGTIYKDKYCDYDYYHTSLDNLDFISAKDLVRTLELYLSAIEKLEMNTTYRSLNPRCSPMLRKRNLYPKLGGQIRQKAASFKTPHLRRKYTILDKSSISGNELDIIGWLMFYGDGKNSLLDVSEKTGFSMEKVHKAAQKLEAVGLLSEAV